MKNKAIPAFALDRALSALEGRISFNRDTLATYPKAKGSGAARLVEDFIASDRHAVAEIRARRWCKAALLHSS